MFFPKYMLFLFIISIDLLYFVIVLCFYSFICGFSLKSVFGLSIHSAKNH